MNITLEQLSQILEKVGISSSQEDEILTKIKDLASPPEEKEESILKESNEEQLFEQEIKEDQQENASKMNQNGNHTYKSLIERWFQVSIRTIQCFLLYFSISHLPQLISNTSIHFNFQFLKLRMNIFLLLLRKWLNRKFSYTSLISNF
jgi:hypothetical protein